MANRLDIRDNISLFRRPLIARPDANTQPPLTTAGRTMEPVSKVIRLQPPLEVHPIDPKRIARNAELDAGVRINQLARSGLLRNLALEGPKHIPDEPIALVDRAAKILRE